MPIDIPLELEISFRTEAKAFNMRDSTQFAAMVSLLRFSVAFAKESDQVSSYIGRIPFLLIADVLERETISVAEKVWTVVEELGTDLVDPKLFSRGLTLSVQ